MYNATLQNYNTIDDTVSSGMFKRSFSSGVQAAGRILNPVRRITDSDGLTGKLFSVTAEAATAATGIAAGVAAYSSGQSMGESVMTGTAAYAQSKLIQASMIGLTAGVSSALNQKALETDNRAYRTAAGLFDIAGYGLVSAAVGGWDGTTAALIGGGVARAVEGATEDREGWQGVHKVAKLGSTASKVAMIANMGDSLYNRASGVYETVQHEQAPQLTADITATKNDTAVNNGAAGKPLMYELSPEEMQQTQFSHASVPSAGMLGTGPGFVNPVMATVSNLHNSLNSMLDQHALESQDSINDHLRPANYVETEAATGYTFWQPTSDGEGLHFNIRDTDANTATPVRIDLLVDGDGDGSVYGPNDFLLTSNTITPESHGEVYVHLPDDIPSDAKMLARAVQNNGNGTFTPYSSAWVGTPGQYGFGAAPVVVDTTAPVAEAPSSLESGAESSLEATTVDSASVADTAPDSQPAVAPANIPFTSYEAQGYNNFPRAGSVFDLTAYWWDPVTHQNGVNIEHGSLNIARIPASDITVDFFTPGYELVNSGWTGVGHADFDGTAVEGSGPAYGVDYDVHHVNLAQQFPGLVQEVLNGEAAIKVSIPVGMGMSADGHPSSGHAIINGIPDPRVWVQDQAGVIAPYDFNGDGHISSNEVVFVSGQDSANGFQPHFGPVSTSMLTYVREFEPGEQQISRWSIYGEPGNRWLTGDNESVENWRQHGKMNANWAAFGLFGEPGVFFTSTDDQDIIHWEALAFRPGDLQMGYYNIDASILEPDNIGQLERYSFTPIDEISDIIAFGEARGHPYWMSNQYSDAEWVEIFGLIDDVPGDRGDRP